ncbi:hypothetical protein FOA52_002805 [Chlamydomonas sp. UWO 241]|nr:hypothetical protein FOA52_002805 [Chlamydomonas sp. UWO 241]
MDYGREEAGRVAEATASRRQRNATMGAQHQGGVVHRIDVRAELTWQHLKVQQKIAGSVARLWELLGPEEHGALLVLHTKHGDCPWVPVKLDQPRRLFKVLGVSGQNLVSLYDPGLVFELGRWTRARAGAACWPPLHACMAAHETQAGALYAAARPGDAPQAAAGGVRPPRALVEVEALGRAYEAVAPEPEYGTWSCSQLRLTRVVTQLVTTTTEGGERAPQPPYQNFPTPPSPRGPRPGGSGRAGAGTGAGARPPSPRRSPAADANRPGAGPGVAGGGAAAPSSSGSPAGGKPRFQLPGHHSQWAGKTPHAWTGRAHDYAGMLDTAPECVASTVPQYAYGPSSRTPAAVQHAYEDHYGGAHADMDVDIEYYSRGPATAGARGGQWAQQVAPADAGGGFDVGWGDSGGGAGASGWGGGAAPCRLSASVASTPRR